MEELSDLCTRAGLAIRGMWGGGERGEIIDVAVTPRTLSSKVLMLMSRRFSLNRRVTPKWLTLMLTL